MNPKKILFIIHFPPPVHGAAMMGQYVKDSGLINTTFNCRYINLGTSITVVEIGKGGLKKWLRYFNILWHTLKNLVRFKPDLVYFTINASGAGFYKDLLVVLLAKIFNKKVVYHYHNKGVKDNQDKTLDNILYKIAFKNVDVILLSKYLYGDIAKYVPHNKVHYCPNGIPRKSIESGSNILVDESNKITLLFLSNLIASKGVFVLLDACKNLSGSNLDFDCIFVGGEGDVSKEVFQKEIDRLGLQKSVKYLGPKYGSEKEKIFSKADIFVFPTHYHNETFGLVNLEAMQHALPVVSTFEGGIPDVVLDGVTGFLVPQHDVEALTEKLEILINDKNLRIKMGDSGKQHYLKNYTLEAFEENLTEILKKIA